MANKHNYAIKILKAFADENRLAVIELLMDGSKCGCELLEALKIGQPTLSHHMRILCEAGLVDAYKEGKWMHYSLSAEGMARAKELVEQYIRYPEQAARRSDCCRKVPCEQMPK